MTFETHNDLPAERGASGKLKWLLIAVAIVVVAAVVVFRLNIAYSTPAAAREVASRFLHALDRGDLETARKFCGPKVDLVGLERHTRDIATWNEPQSESNVIGVRRNKPGQPGRYAFSMDVEYATFKRPFSVVVEEEPPGTWKVSSYVWN